ncbi:MAG: BrnA antitoxin family protein [Gammaproteobacteria bacterium]
MKSKRGSSATTSAEGKTDWARVRATKDADIQFTADAPRTSAEDWEDAVAHRVLPLPTRKEQIALRVDADVLAWYRAQGPGWQRA